MHLHRDGYGWRDLLSLHSDLGVKKQHLPMSHFSELFWATKAMKPVRFCETFTFS